MEGGKSSSNLQVHNMTEGIFQTSWKCWQFQTYLNYSSMKQAHQILSAITFYFPSVCYALVNINSFMHITELLLHKKENVYLADFKTRLFEDFHSIHPELGFANRYISLDTQHKYQIVCYYFKKWQTVLCTSIHSLKNRYTGRGDFNTSLIHVPLGRKQ